MSKIITLKNAQDLAIKNNGLCLSKKYINAKTYMLWECNERHRWKSKFNNINSRGRWCSKCAGNKKLSIKIANQIAHDMKGKCLSNKYINSGQLMKWECKFGHVWSACLDHIRNSKSWCPECGYKETSKKLNNSCSILHWKNKEDLICVASYEKAVVEYLNKNKINFQWQHKTFKIIFSDGRKTTYRPDFYLSDYNIWVEIKGYFRKASKEKWDWFCKVYPNSELWDKGKLEKMNIL